MRTFGVLVAGWLLGGAMIVLLGGSSRAEVRPATAVRESAARVAAVSRALVPPPKREGTKRPQLAFRKPQVLEKQRQVALPHSRVLIPVLGIASDQLRDTFAEARGGGRIHRAMDILAPRGTPVVAAVDGTVRKLFTSKAGGLTIYQFDRAEERVYYYAHLDSYASGLAEGAFVAQGTVIGYVGTTGNAAADTPHLHFSVEMLPPTKEWWKGEPVNPYPLLTR